MHWLILAPINDPPIYSHLISSNLIISFHFLTALQVKRLVHSRRLKGLMRAARSHRLQRLHLYVILCKR